MAGQIDRGIREPSLLVDLQALGLDGIAATGGRTRDRCGDDAGGSGRRGLDGAVRAPSPPPPARPRRRSCGMSARSAATSASTRAAGTTAASSGTAGSAAATPATRRSATTASTTSSPATASRRTRPISRRLSPPVARRSSCARRSGERELPLLDLYRRPTADDRSLLTLAPGELVTAVRLPAPPDASVVPACSGAAGVLVPARRGRGRAARGRRASRGGGRRQRPAGARPGRPARRPARATRRAPGSVRCWRRWPSARSQRLRRRRRTDPALSDHVALGACRAARKPHGGER